MEPDDAPNLADEAVEIGQGLIGQATDFLQSLLRPWNAYQVGIAIAILAVAWILAAIIRPRLHEWMRSREGWPKWRFRALLTVHKRMRGIVFVVLIWIVIAVMREITWPSRTHLLAVIANLATAWLFVILATRVIGNGLLRGIVRWGAWAWVTLNILGLTDEAVRLLDSAALEMGDTRLSLWLLIRAIAVLGLFIYVARLLARGSASRIRANAGSEPVRVRGD